MAGKLELEVRRENPAFAKLLDILNNSLLQDGKPRETASRLKQVMDYKSIMIYTPFQAFVLYGHSLVSHTFTNIT